MCSPFLRGFLPGTCVGLCTSLLFISLWRHPSYNTVQSFDEELYSPALPQRGVHVIVNDVVIQREAVTEDNRILRIVKDTGTTTTTTTTGETNDVMNRITKTWTATITGSYDLLVLVHSSYGQRSLRDTIRSTWLSRNGDPSEKFLARFVVGVGSLDVDALANLAAESMIHKDMVFLRDIEEEANVEWPSSKKLLKSLTWAVATKVNFSAVFKCNSATFVNLDQLLTKLPPSREMHVLGYFAGGVKAHRYSDNPVLVEEDWFLCSHYLPYPEGGGYILSSDLVQLLVQLGPHLRHYRHDDIGLGVWLSPLRGVQKHHSLGFNTGYYSRGCQNSFLVSHGETVESMAVKAMSLETKGVMCENEYQTRLPYHFNWIAPAARCCVRKADIH